MDIDKPLDEIIASKPKTRRGGRPNRGGAGAAGGGRGGATARARASAPKAVAPPTAKPVASEATKIIISNLPQDVTEAAVRDLMQSTIGPVKSVQMTYNSSGKSIGSATVLFRNKGDANKAYTSYNNRMIDNQRPMRVEIALDPSTLVSLASRVAPAPAAAAARGGAARGGRGGARGGAGKPRAARPTKKTAEELDAEMASYKDTSA